MKNRLGWDWSKRLLCANLSTALVDYLCLEKLTQRETDLPAASHSCLDQHFSAYQATRPFGGKKTDKLARVTLPSLQPGLCCLC